MAHCMITPLQILNKYRSAETYLAPVQLRVRESIQTFADGRGFAVTSRLKTLESVSEKVETGRFKSWSEIDDLVAFTVVVPTLAHEASVVTFLQGAFRQVALKPRGSSSKPPDVFRFDCTRFIGKLVSPDDADAPIFNVPFEVQIKSAFEHAWSVTTHSLTYKSADVNWSKLRLAAQLKAAVERWILWFCLSRKRQSTLTRVFGQKLKLRLS